MIIDAARKYITDMLSKGDKSGSEPKALLLDDETKLIISLVYTQSELLEKNVLLPDLVSKPREKLKHMRALVFIRPSSLSLLRPELEAGNFKDYYIYFSNITTDSDLDALAQADKHDLIKEVHEYFLDFFAISRNLFSLEIKPTDIYDHGDANTWNPKALERSKKGLASILLALKRWPLIRYEKNSAMCKILATDLSSLMRVENSLFSTKETAKPPILLLLDRRNDPFTPLLSQWTYQAIVHELIGIELNRVKLPRESKDDDLSEVVISSDDAFFERTMYRHMGEVSAEALQLVKNAVDSRDKITTGANSIADLKKMMLNAPKVKSDAYNAKKHVAILEEVSKRYKKDHLIEVSEIEQGIVCGNDHAADVRGVENILSNPDVSKESKLRLVLLYALRHETTANNSVDTFKSRLAKLGFKEDLELKYISKILEYGGNNFRQAIRRATPQNFAAIASNFFSQITSNNQDLADVITQHKPVMYETLDSLLHQKLPEATHPFVDNATSQIPQDVIVFFVGGVTYEESKHAADLSKSFRRPGGAAFEETLRLVVGGTNIVNAKDFLKEVEFGTH